MSLILPRHEWPPTDRALWDRIFREGDLLDDQGPLARLRLTSRETLANGYGRWLAWLRDTQPAALKDPPATRVTLDRLEAWLADLAHTAPMSQLSFVERVLRVMQAGFPDQNWSRHKKLQLHLKRRAGRGEQTRKIGRVLSSSVLLEAGQELALVRADDADNRIWRATRIRNGAIIALLSLLPIRRRALTALRIGTSVLITGDRITISLSAELTKTGVPWESGVPEPVLPSLLRYLKEARPFLLNRGPGGFDDLWIGRKGIPLSYGMMAVAITRTTHAILGIRVPPHFFRDAAATTLARGSPQAAAQIRPVLAHTSSKTAERYYNHATTLEAGRDYAAVVARLKGKKP